MIGRAPLRLGDQTFGHWTVVRRRGRKHGQIAWLCRCSCGATRVLVASVLRTGKSRSCGCQPRDVDHPKKHPGPSRARLSAEAVLAIVALLAHGLLLREIAAVFGVTGAHVSMVKTGRARSDVTGFGKKSTR